MQQIVMALLLTSCSLIYDPGKIHASDGGGSADAFVFADAPVDTPYVTADPSLVHAMDLQPQVIYEGQGIDNSRPAVLTIRGVNFAAGASVTILPTNSGDIADLMVGTVAVAADANSLAVPVIANIMAPGGGVGVPLTITITESGFSTTLAWTEVALDELTAVIQLPPTQQRYSRVALAAAGSLPTGGPRVTIHSMSSISLAAFHADALTTAPGAGGCKGGPPALGACPGGGGAGTDAAMSAGIPTDGGGAGFLTKGGDGGPGTGGPIVGDRYVASYGNPANVASGGGNGGNVYNTPGTGGLGGAGGGTLELHAEGDLTTAALTALGGAGTAGMVAQGGGGAGGLVILRSGHALSVASVTVTGGLGGSSLPTNQGSLGRIRFDAALGSVDNAQAGPAFAIFTPLVTDQHTLAIDLQLPSEIVFKLSRLDQRGVLVYLPDVMSATGTTTVDVPLINGWNKLCLTVPGGVYEDDVANECVELAFITH